MIFQAHKGVSAEYPENTMPAFEAAIAQGYGIIELDVSVTKDNVLVLLHDTTINRVARHRDGSEIETPVEIAEITYEEALGYDFGVRMGPQFAGTTIARFSDVLELAQKSGVRLKIDNKYQRFSEAQKQLLFEAIRPYQKTAMLTSKTVEGIKDAVDAFPQMSLHYDGPVSEEELAALSALLPKEKLYVWLPVKSRLTTWVKVAFADAALAAMVKAHAQLGVWILAEESEAEFARSLGADVIETNGEVKPSQEN